MKRFFLIFILVFLTSCASIEFNEIANNATLFRPKVVVLLPVRMPDGYEHDAAKAEKAVIDNALKTQRFEKILSPEQARLQMADNKELQDSIISFTTKLKTLGVTDKDLAQKIADAYLADTLIVADVSRWGYSEILGEKFAEVAISIRLIDASTGSVYWKAMHKEKETYSLFRPDLGNIANDVAKRIFKNMPKLPKVK